MPSSNKTAFRAIDGLAERYRADVVDMKADVLAGLAKKARTPADHASLAELLGAYADVLDMSGQPEAAAHVRALLAAPDAFRAIKPAGEIVDQTISTE